MPSDVDNLKSIRSAYIQALLDEANFQAANGAQFDYSVDGESISREAWRSGLMQKISDLTAQINAVGGPFLIRSRGKA